MKIYKLSNKKETVKTVESANQLPEKKENMTIITKNEIKLSVFVKKYCPENIICSRVAINSLNKSGVKFLNKFFDPISDIKIVFRENSSDYKNRDAFGSLKVYSVLADIHTKIFSVKSDSDFFTIIGTGSFSTNSDIEYYYLDFSEKTFLFCKKWIDSL